MNLFKIAGGTFLLLEDGWFRVFEGVKWSLNNCSWRNNSILILLSLMSWQAQPLVSNTIKNLKSKFAQEMRISRSRLALASGICVSGYKWKTNLRSHQKEASGFFISSCIVQVQFRSCWSCVWSGCSWIDKNRSLCVFKVSVLAVRQVTAQHMWKGC